ncbi:hypothetical protein TWF225_005238 [Orbilia oligospora]|nr:hypothetical protein TWF225_005238 [Orbilia oligospora]KAF3252387.1 hypothetical protein TWF128_006751 [Orbilia oligospora]
MIMISLIDHMTEMFDRDTGSKVAISYFFCQATDSRLNNALAVVKGLLSQFISNPRYPSLVRYLKSEIDIRGKNYFEDPNAFYALERILLNICADPQYNTFYFLVDALDECIGDLDRLLKLICSTCTRASRIRWLVTSRNRPDIEAQFEYAGLQLQISLEEHGEQINTTVEAYIHSKLQELSIKKRYRVDIQERVGQLLREKAGGIFLWVHLACKELERVYSYNAVTTLNGLPSGLNGFYGEELKYLDRSDYNNDFKSCSKILSAMVVVFRPLSLQKMVTIAELPSEMNEIDVEVQVKSCGSFLTTHNRIISFVHQSAKDFLDKNIGSRLIIPNGLGYQHQEICTRSMRQLENELRTDICSLKRLDFAVKDLRAEHKDMIDHLRYACYHWVDHLALAEPPMAKAELVLRFLEKHLLHWMELTILLDPTFDIVTKVKWLGTTMEGASNEYLNALLYDFRRFSQYHKAVPPNEGTFFNLGMIALSNDNKTFAVGLKYDTHSLILWGVSSGAILQHLLVSNRDVISWLSLEFSPDNQMIAVIAKLRPMQEQGEPAASPRDSRVSIGIWNVVFGERTHTWEIQEVPHPWQTSIVWIPGNAPKLVFAITLKDLWLLHADRGSGSVSDQFYQAIPKNYDGDGWCITKLACSFKTLSREFDLPWEPTGFYFTAHEEAIRIFEIPSKDAPHEVQLASPSSMAASPNGRYLAICQRGFITLWDYESISPPQTWNAIGDEAGRELQDRETPSRGGSDDNRVTKLEFSSDNNLLVFRTNRIIKIWDVQSGSLLDTLDDCPDIKSDFRDHPYGSDRARCKGFLFTGKLAFMPHLSLRDDVYALVQLRTFDPSLAIQKTRRLVSFRLDSSDTDSAFYDGSYRDIKFSPDRSLLVMESSCTVTLRDTASGQKLCTFGGENRRVTGTLTNFSSNGQKFIVALHTQRSLRFTIYCLESLKPAPVMRLSHTQIWSLDLLLPQNLVEPQLSLTTDPLSLISTTDWFQFPPLTPILLLDDWLWYQGERILHFPFETDRVRVITSYRDLCFIGTASGVIIVVRTPYKYMEQTLMEESFLEISLQSSSSMDTNPDQIVMN